MLSAIDIKTILEDITFPKWQIVLRFDDKRPYLQVQCKDDVCNITGKSYDWHGRKWMLSYWMVPSEVVRTAYKAVMTAMEHEVSEQFKYKGIAIYDPHINVERLVDVLSDPKNLEVRAEPLTRKVS